MEEHANQQRRSNLRLTELPEGTEKEDACAFLMAWLPKALDVEQSFTIEQVYQLGTNPQN